MDKQYTDADCKQFVEDMEGAGLEIEHYRGRGFWQGPAARADSIQDILSNTNVPCQWDNMGLGFIVYPNARDEGIDSDD